MVFPSTVIPVKAQQETGTLLKERTQVRGQIPRSQKAGVWDNSQVQRGPADQEGIEGCSVALQVKAYLLWGKKRKVWG